MLLLLMATVRCLVPDQSLAFSTDGSCARAEAIVWIQACDAWLKRQSQKHRTLAMYQVMCLRLLAASINHLKVKEAYVDTEALLNYFRAAGMHRDVKLLTGRCSAFEQEMRTRLWSTVAELELQASLDRGMPSSLTSLNADCGPPLNICDEDLKEDCLQLPAAHADHEYMSTSFLRWSSKSLALRIHLCALINSKATHSISYGAVLDYEQQITEALHSLPKWTDKNSSLALALLELQLRQFLLLLHTPPARQSGSSQSSYSRIACFDTSRNILNLHSKLISSGNFSLCLLRHDVYRAALSICHNAFMSCLSPS